MPNKWNPGCDCCECWKSIATGEITTTAVANGLLFDQEMPTSSQWTARYIKADGESYPLIFGANATLSTGYRVDFSSPASSVTDANRNKIELVDIATSSVVAEKEVYTRNIPLVGDPRPRDLLLHSEPCSGNPYTETVEVYATERDEARSRGQGVLLFKCEVSDRRWGLGGASSVSSGFGFGSKDRLLVPFPQSTSDYPCHLCGSQEHEFGGSKQVCVGDTIRVTISDLPTSGYSFSAGGTTYEISNISGGGTYNTAPECPACVYKDILGHISYDWTDDGGATTNSRKVVLSSSLYFISKDDYRHPGSSIISDSVYRTCQAEPNFFRDLFIPGPDNGVGNRYEATGLCKWEKFKIDTTTYGRWFPEWEARIVAEYV